MQRAAKAQAVYQMASQNPQSFKINETYKYVFRLLGLSGAETLLQDQTAPPPPDLKGQAALINAQAKSKEADAKMAGVQVDHLNAVVDGENRAQDRTARVDIAHIKLKGDLIKQDAAQQHEHQVLNTSLMSDHVLAAKKARNDQIAQHTDLSAAADQQQAGLGADALMQLHQAREDRLHHAADLMQPDVSPTQDQPQ